MLSRITHIGRRIPLRMLVATLWLFPTAASDAAEHGPEPLRLHLEGPITTWDEAIPLGNGMSGGLLWGEGSEVRLSLDRGDLWDERLPDLLLQDNWNYDTIRRLVAAGNQAEISRLFDVPYDRIPFPTKLPGGRLVLTLAPSQTCQYFELDMRRAVGQTHLGDGQLECFFAATRPVAMLRVAGPPLQFHFQRPQGLDRLGYAAAQFGESPDMIWMVQKAALGLEYAVVVARQRQANATHLAVAIVSNRDGQNPLEVGKQHVHQALEAGYQSVLTEHVQWWDRFWSISSVTIPDPLIQQHYNLVRYFYGAASRPDAPPMPLQGVWTRDDGDLPPWKGDYHHDLNTQMTYLPYLTAGLFEAGESFLNDQWRLLPTYRKFAEHFFHVDGAAMPGVATQAGKPTGGWSQYSLSPTNALWVGQSFYLHWRYTADDQFLADKAYPWLSAMATGIEQLLQQRNGHLYLPLSSSPEIHDNSLCAWLPPNSNYDLALMRWAFAALAEMAGVLEKTDEQTHWRELLSKLDQPLADDQHILMFAQGDPFNASHRHHSHTMEIHPLGTMHIESDERQRATIRATLKRMRELGTRAWVGYSFSWAAAMHARAGEPEAALDFLQKYAHAFILRNGFHANGDQTRSGLSGFTYRPFTLEGNFLCMEAVHEMVLQSWPRDFLTNPLPIVRVFPAMPWQWHDAAFDRLRAQGGYIVSARRENNATTWFRIEATRDGLLKIRDNFLGQVPQFNRKGVNRAGGHYEIHLNAGESLEATLPKPPEIPPAPENATPPFPSRP